MARKPRKPREDRKPRKPKRPGMGHEVTAKPERRAKLIDVKCRDCGLVQQGEKMQFWRASKPRCIACGGIVDAVKARDIRGPGRPQQAQALAESLPERRPR